MYSSHVSDATRVIEAIQHGDPKAADELLPLVYEELRKAWNFALGMLPLPLNGTEREGLHRSAGILREAIQSLNLK